MLDRARQIESQLSVWRRDFHMHPEIGFSEARTSAKVAEVLQSLGYRVRTGVGRTGVVAERGQGRPLIGMRADMDALPILEANDTPYASQTPGLMHACGHDAHTAIGLGVATLLAQEDFPGAVRFIFQPAEEVEDDEGHSGAYRMVEDGATKDLDMLLALHVDAAYPVGQVTLDAGLSSAGVDTLYATVIGHGGHGAYPHKVIDPIYITAHVILAINAITSRRMSPFDTAVISLGAIHGGHADNVIPQEVDLVGTIRYVSQPAQEQIHREIERALSLARNFGGDYKLRIETGYPALYNHPDAVALVHRVASEMLGPECVLPPRPSLGAEDFGLLAHDCPGLIFMLGARVEGDERKHHHPRFDIDEGCLPIGAAVLAQSMLTYLRETAPK